MSTDPRQPARSIASIFKATHRTALRRGGTTRAFARKHPLAGYFTLAFAISWGGVLLLAGGPGRLPGTPERAEALLPLVVLAMLAGPPAACLLMTGLASGREGMRELLRRMARWRVGARWYALALVAVPALFIAVSAALALTSSAFLPGVVTSDDKATVLALGMGYGLGAGFLEELGWTGLAVPRLRQRHGPVAAGLILGLVWGAWHFLTNTWGSGTPSGALSLGLFLPAQFFAVAVLPAYRVIMVWAHDRTGSLLLAMLMHASFTASWLITMPVGMSGMPFFAWYLSLAVALWVGAAAVARTARRAGE